MGCGSRVGEQPWFSPWWSGFSGSRVNHILLWTNFLCHPSIVHQGNFVKSVDHCESSYPGQTHTSVGNAREGITCHHRLKSGTSTGWHFQTAHNQEFAHVSFQAVSAMSAWNMGKLRSRRKKIWTGASLISIHVMGSMLPRFVDLNTDLCASGFGVPRSSKL